MGKKQQSMLENAIHKHANSLGHRGLDCTTLPLPGSEVTTGPTEERHSGGHLSGGMPMQATWILVQDNKL